jgi:hypothetical protein
MEIPLNYVTIKDTKVVILTQKKKKYKVFYQLKKYLNQSTNKIINQTTNKHNKRQNRSS